MCLYLNMVFAFQKMCLKVKVKCWQQTKRNEAAVKAIYIAKSSKYENNEVEIYFFFTYSSYFKTAYLDLQVRVWWPHPKLFLFHQDCIDHLVKPNIVSNLALTTLSWILTQLWQKLHIWWLFLVILTCKKRYQSHKTTYDSIIINRVTSQYGLQQLIHQSTPISGKKNNIFYWLNFYNATKFDDGISC